MNKSILNIEIQEFIDKNLNSEITKLILKGTSFSSVETTDIIEQIETKKRCQKKLPTWYNTKNIYYPNKVNVEQSSSEITALFKAQLVQGNKLIDLTGGFGVDCYYFAKRFKEVVHCELNNKLSKIVSHNYTQLKTNNIKTVIGDGLNYINTFKTHFDWIYIDPSRRHQSKGKVFFLSDCLPNVPQHLDLLFKASKSIMIKTSPLLDISAGLKELQYVKKIHVVALNNEVKELLWILEKDYATEIIIETTNIKNAFTEQFNFKLKDESLAVVDYSHPLTYLYEPNAAILKAGAFDSIAYSLQVAKLQKHSHLYTSDTLTDFPGRRFKIDKTIVYSKKLLKKESFTYANITTRNFPESVEQLRKKHRIKEGGTLYLFFTTDSSNSKIVIICSKIA